MRRRKARRAELGGTHTAHVETKDVETTVEEGGSHVPFNFCFVSLSMDFYLKDFFCLWFCFSKDCLRICFFVLGFLSDFFGFVRIFCLLILGEHVPIFLRIDMSSNQLFFEEDLQAKVNIGHKNTWISRTRYFLFLVAFHQQNRWNITGKNSSSRLLELCVSKTACRYPLNKTTQLLT